MNIGIGTTIKHAALAAAILFAPFVKAEPEEKDFTPEFVAQCKAKAEAGDLEGQALYGRALSKGWGVDRNDEKAVKWLQKAAEAGNASAQYYLAHCYWSGRGVEKDAAKTVEWFQKAAEQGHALAQTDLGFCYRSGWGVEKDEAKARECFRKAMEMHLKAAEQGDAQAQLHLALFYSWDHIWKIGVKDDVKAAEWCRKAAEQGHAEAQGLLGLYYESGRGVEKDAAKAVEWYRKSAEQGHAEAQCSLGVCYGNGRGVEKDEAKAVEWFRKAAEQGDAEAQCCLGVCYGNGRGVEKDAAKAVEWYAKAAKRGHAGAQYRLGVCYANGIGVEKDEAKASEWYSKAAKQGHEKAKAALEKIAKSAPPTQSVNVTWTTNETEKFWASVASSATRIVTAPRFYKADAEKGEGVLEAFGAQYMPNAYDFYGKAREKAIEREQLLKEKFPNGAESDTTGGGLYEKIRKATAKAVSEYFRRRDELCHFYLMHKAGIMTDAELSKIDESKICVMLPLSGEWPEKWKVPDAPKAAELDFARKYKPETFAAYERLKAVYDEGVKQYDSLDGDMLVIDAVRGGGVLAPLASRLREVSSKLQEIAKTLSEENLLHEVEEITAEKLADSDAKFGVEVRAFEKTLPVRDYAQAWFAKNWTAKEMWDLAAREAPVYVLPLSMVAIPGKGYAMCKYEVTQALWEAVMGNNPSKFKGPDRPVEEVSWNDCQKFLEKLNAMPEVKASGKTYRLPTADEWKFACRAGATGDYCKLADGTEITEGTLLMVAWYEKNSDRKTHPVGQKKPNAFGLYDMHGNVSEWTSTGDGYGQVHCGGGWSSSREDYCNTRGRPQCKPDGRYHSLGFRLAW